MRPVAAQSGADSHGMSSFGDLKYSPDFKSFEYVNVDAPKGGTFSTVAPGTPFAQEPDTFNSLNAYIFKGTGASGMDQTFASLMTRAADEPDASYGLAARAVKISPDQLNYRFTMRPEARFHDGSRLTAHDAAFSLNILKTKGHPIIGLQLASMRSAEALDDMTLTVTFAPKRGRDVPLLVATLPIFSKAYYATRAFEESTLDVPLGSGPYKVRGFETGHHIEFERVKDWWGSDLPVSRGAFNFDVVRYEYYRDRDAAFQGFGGRNYLFREEFTSRVWNTRYDFPAVKDGRIKRELLPDGTASAAQGWFINVRREKFADKRVREALGLAFDFEWTNKTIFYGAYSRTHSPFQNSDLMANGLPSPDELKLLEPFRGTIPDDLFAEPYTPPVSDGSGQDRKLLLQAGQLLTDAGYQIKDRKRLLPSGEPLTIEFLASEPSLQALHAPYIKNLGILGIDATLRIVDGTQYQSRLKDFDFDVTMKRYGMAATPGDALRTYFSSQAARLKGSENLAGIASPALDALIDTIIAADSRDALRTACRAFDRVFRAGRYWIPQWYSASHRIAYWDVFAHPANIPKYAGGVGAPELWWSDETKAKKPEQAK
jgi:microcin C transport system substrate-binding protein